KFAEDALDDQRLRWIDLTLASHQLTLAIQATDHPVAIAHCPGGEALLDPPAQAAMGFLRKVFQEQRIHRSLEADMKLVDLAFGERDERNPRELEMLVEGRDIGLIARYAVEGFGEHDIKLAGPRIGKQLLDAGTQDHARARDGGIFIDAFDLPAFARRALAAEAKLVGDRRRILLVRRIAGIERGADHGWSPCDHGLKRRMPV